MVNGTAVVIVLFISIILQIANASNNPRLAALEDLKRWNDNERANMPKRDVRKEKEAKLAKDRKREQDEDVKYGKFKADGGAKLTEEEEYYNNIVDQIEDLKVVLSDGDLMGMKRIEKQKELNALKALLDGMNAERVKAQENINVELANRKAEQERITAQENENVELAKRKAEQERVKAQEKENVELAKRKEHERNEINAKHHSEDISEHRMMIAADTHELEHEDQKLGNSGNDSGFENSDVGSDHSEQYHPADNREKLHRRHKKNSGSGKPLTGDLEEGRPITLRKIMSKVELEEEVGKIMANINDATEVYNISGASGNYSFETVHITLTRLYNLSISVELLIQYHPTYTKIPYEMYNASIARSQAKYNKALGNRQKGDLKEPVQWLKALYFELVNESKVELAKPGISSKIKSSYEQSIKKLSEEVFSDTHAQLLQNKLGIEKARKALAVCRFQMYMLAEGKGIQD